MAKSKRPVSEENDKALHVGQRLRQLREELKVVQTEMAAILDCSQGSIGSMERSGTLSNLTIKYLEFLDSKGYNVSWIVIRNNDHIAKHKIFQDLEFVKLELVDKVQKLKENNAEQKKQLAIISSILSGKE